MELSGFVPPTNAFSRISGSLGTMVVSLLCLAAASAILALYIHGPTRSAWLRVAVCAIAVPLALASSYLLDRFVADPEFRESLAVDVIWVGALCLPALALGLGRGVWKWIIRLIGLIFVFEVGFWMPHLLRHVSDEALKQNIITMTNCSILGAIVFGILWIASQHVKTFRDALARHSPWAGSSLRRLAWPLGICVAGFLVVLFREPLLALWPGSALRHEAWMLGLGSLFALTATYLGLKALDEFGSHPVPRSFRAAAPLAAVAVYWLLAISPDGRCLPFLVLMALLPAWGRWHVSTLWGALLGLLLISLVHASLTNVATFGPRLFLYLSITCFCYGYFFVPREVDANRPA